MSKVCWLRDSTVLPTPLMEVVKYFFWYARRKGKLAQTVWLLQLNCHKVWGLQHGLHRVRQILYSSGADIWLHFPCRGEIYFYPRRNAEKKVRNKSGYLLDPACTWTDGIDFDFLTSFMLTKVKLLFSGLSPSWPLCKQAVVPPNAKEMSFSFREIRLLWWS